MPSNSIETRGDTLRWGIIGCGMISSWFVTDICLDRPKIPTKHVVGAIGSSSLEKAKSFVTKYCPTQSPTLYASYQEVYDDPQVDIVYIGTPHALHFQNALDAINAGKHVLCEKPLTINAKQAQVLADAAINKCVFLMEGIFSRAGLALFIKYSVDTSLTAVWTRFFPIVNAVQKLVHTEKIIGNISRVFIDFAIPMPISKLPLNARTADPALGAGALLDIGIYTLTWASILLDQHPQQISIEKTQPPVVSSSLSIVGGVDDITTIVINYPSLHAQAICTSSMNASSNSEFCRIEGSEGIIIIGGKAASRPDYLIIKKNGSAEEKIEFETESWGFWYEQDAIAADLMAGKTQNAVMPLSETLRMMKLMDGIREANGLKYPQDT